MVTFLSRNRDKAVYGKVVKGVSHGTVVVWPMASLFSMPGATH